MNDLRKKLQRIYFLFWGASLFSGILIVKFPVISVSKEFNVSLESISILLAIFGIWGAYAFFKKRLKKILGGSLDKEDCFSEYRKSFQTGLMILFIIIIADTLIFSVTRFYSSLLCVGMILIATIPVYPTENKIKKDLDGG
ncbi:MAG: hypothetical protein FWF54_04635 [Candidatus Azobacteroides sp.]|nr:hypothetical protein [Candidatus Azobacteroides sp.]